MSTLTPSNTTTTTAFTPPKLNSDDPFNNTSMASIASDDLDRLLRPRGYVKPVKKPTDPVLDIFDPLYTTASAAPTTTSMASNPFEDPPVSVESRVDEELEMLRQEQADSEIARRLQEEEYEAAAAEELRRPIANPSMTAYPAPVSYTTPMTAYPAPPAFTPPVTYVPPPATAGRLGVYAPPANSYTPPSTQPLQHQPPQPIPQHLPPSPYYQQPFHQQPIQYYPQQQSPYPQQPAPYYPSYQQPYYGAHAQPAVRPYAPSPANLPVVYSAGATAQAVHPFPEAKR